MDKTIISDNFPFPRNEKIIERAIKKCGSQAELARKLQDSAKVKCYPQKVNEWRVRGIIPPYWVKHVAKVIGIEPSKIDPVLYD